MRQSKALKGKHAFIIYCSSRNGNRFKYYLIITNIASEIGATNQNLLIGSFDTGTVCDFIDRVKRLQELRK
jgi:hypothetical protein